MTRPIGLAAIFLLSRWASAAPGVDVRAETSDVLGQEYAAADDYHWVDTWTSMPQLVESSNMPPSPYVSTQS